MVKGKTHHFAARGLYNGLVLLGDRESGSFWDHITGECVHGPLKGYQLKIFPLLHMDVRQALATHPDAQVAISRQSLKQGLMRWRFVSAISMDATARSHAWTSIVSMLYGRPYLSPLSSTVPPVCPKTWSNAQSNLASAN